MCTVKCWKWCLDGGNQISDLFDSPWLKSGTKSCSSFGMQGSSLGRWMMDIAFLLQVWSAESGWESSPLVERKSGIQNEFGRREIQFTIICEEHNMLMAVVWPGEDRVRNALNTLNGCSTSYESLLRKCLTKKNLTVFSFWVGWSQQTVSVGERSIHVLIDDK